MQKKLPFSSNVLIGSMLFGLFFGAGNIIFPIHMGQEAGANIIPATIGFLITGVGLPFLGVVAIGASKSDGLFDLASRVHPVYGYIITVLLYLTIGPFFALPRTGTVSFEVGIAPYISDEHMAFALAVFTVLFFSAALFFALRPNKILTWVGKVLTPLFLVFLGALILMNFLKPMGSISSAPVNGIYATSPFFKGFTEGYNTMDALASLAFGIIVVQNIKGLGIEEPGNIALHTVKAGIITIILMSAIYASLSYLGTTSISQFEMSSNGGIAMAQISRYYFGNFGSILLALIITIGCLKTAIGLITACAETFSKIFPNTFSYKVYVIIFTVFASFAANLGLTHLISFSIPILMFLYPLAIAIIILGLISPLFKDRQVVYVTTTLFTIIVSFADMLNAMPDGIKNLEFVQNILSFYKNNLPLFELGMGWVIPMAAGLIIGLIICAVTNTREIQSKKQ
jgi:LIVCS family branched-chain amino acid:cation transporter